jgi:hypothetical protein
MGQGQREMLMWGNRVLMSVEEEEGGQGQTQVLEQGQVLAGTVGRGNACLGGSSRSGGTLFLST